MSRKLPSAINNGLTVDEIKEALLHATVYCGIPAGLDAFKAANEVLTEMGTIPVKALETETKP
jgi:4-carboxymuconolactone decarboxylase